MNAHTTAMRARCKRYLTPGPVRLVELIHEVPFTAPTAAACGVIAHDGRVVAVRVVVAVKSGMVALILRYLPVTFEERFIAFLAVASLFASFHIM